MRGAADKGGTCVADHSDEVFMSTEAPPSSAPALRPVRTAPARSIGPVLLRLHFYAGLFVAPFLLIAALSGLAYAFTPQFDRLTYGDELVVDNPGGAIQPLSAQIAAARATHPDGAVTA